MRVLPIVLAALCAASPALSRDHVCETVTLCDSVTGCTDAARGRDATFLLRLADDNRSGTMEIDGRRYRMALQDERAGQRVYLVSEGTGHLSLATLDRNARRLTLGGLSWPRGEARAVTRTAECRARDR